MPSRTSERLDRDDRQIAAIRELIHEGTRLVIDTRKDIEPLPALLSSVALVRGLIPYPAH